MKDLSGSIGIVPNKLLAKLASEMKKPDGLTVINPEDVGMVLETMPIKELCGIGKKMELHLNMLGILTCGQLGKFPIDILKRKFGVVENGYTSWGSG